jgi:hypothetical protein
MEILPALPQPRWHHCLAVLDSDTLFVAGGLVNKGKSDTALVYMAGRRQWGGIKARMPGGPRSNHICGVSTLPGGAKEVIVAGGYGGHVRYLDTVEIYSVSEYKWRTSNPMPWGVISDAAVIQYKGCKVTFPLSLSLNSLYFSFLTLIVFSKLTFPYIGHFFRSFKCNSLQLLKKFEQVPWNCH